MPLLKSCPCVIVVPVGATLEGAVLAYALACNPLWFTHVTIVETDAVGSVSSGGRNLAELFPREVQDFWNQASLLPCAGTFPGVDSSSPGGSGSASTAASPPNESVTACATTDNRADALYILIAEKLKRPDNFKRVRCVGGGPMQELSTQSAEDGRAATEQYNDELGGGSSRRGRLMAAGDSQTQPLSVDEVGPAPMEVDMSRTQISFGEAGYSQKFQYLFFLGDSQVAAAAASTFPDKVFHLTPREREEAPLAGCGARRQKALVDTKASRVFPLTVCGRLFSLSLSGQKPTTASQFLVWLAEAVEIVQAEEAAEEPELEDEDEGDRKKPDESKKRGSWMVTGSVVLAAAVLGGLLLRRCSRGL